MYLSLTVDNLPTRMQYNPGVLAHPENGAVLVYMEKVYHVQSVGGGYSYSMYPVIPSPSKRYSATMFIPDWMANC